MRIRKGPALICLLGIAGLFRLLGEAPLPAPRPRETLAARSTAVHAPTLRTRAPDPLPVRAAPAPTEPPVPKADRRGHVVDPEGRPLARAGLAWWTEPPQGVYRCARARQVDRRRWFVSDDDGTFPMPARVRSGMRVRVSKDGYYPLEETWTPPQDGTPAIMVLHPHPTIEGVVYDAGGRPAGFLHVRVFALEGGDAVGDRLAEMHTSNLGDWRFPLPAGRYLVRIAGAAGPIIERIVEAVDGRATCWDAQLPADTFVRGRLVVPAAVQEEHFALELYVAGEDPRRLDAEDGGCGNEWCAPEDRSFRFQRPAGEQPYWIAVRRDGLRTLPLLVVGPLRGARDAAEIRIPDDAARGAGLRARTWIVRPLDEPGDDADVDDEDGVEESALDLARRASFTVRLRDAYGFTTFTQVHGGTDRFLFEGLPAGRCTLRVEAYDDDYALLERSVVLEVGRMHDLEELVVR